MRGLFKLDLEPPDVPERVFVELQIQWLCEHICESTLQRDRCLLGPSGYDCMLCLYLLVSGLCFVGVDSVE